MTNNLTLQQMEKLGIGAYMSDKEVQKAIDKALEEQNNYLETSNVVETPNKPTLEDVLRDGGLFTYTLNKKKYKLNVLTKADLALLDNASNNVEEGIEYDIVSPYRYHIRNSHDNYVTLRSKSYEEAQQVIDSIYSKGIYKVSCSVL